VLELFWWCLIRLFTKYFVDICCLTFFVVVSKYVKAFWSSTILVLYIVSLVKIVFEVVLVSQILVSQILIKSNFKPFDSIHMFCESYQLFPNPLFMFFKNLNRFKIFSKLLNRFIWLFCLLCMTRLICINVLWIDSIFI
jgi:hypothetical protein